MIRIPLRRPSLRDPQYRALQGLARIAVREASQRPLDALQGVAGLARELTDARHAALVVVDGEDNIEGFVASGLTVEQERKLKSAPLGHGRSAACAKTASPFALAISKRIVPRLDFRPGTPR